MVETPKAELCRFFTAICMIFLRAELYLNFVEYLLYLIPSRAVFQESVTTAADAKYLSFWKNVDFLLS